MAGGQHKMPIGICIVRDAKGRLRFNPTKEELKDERMRSIARRKQLRGDYSGWDRYFEWRRKDGRKSKRNSHKRND